MLISTHLHTSLCIENIRYNILNVSNYTLIWSTRRRCHCARPLPIAHSRQVQILIYLFDLSPRKRFVYLLEIVDHICCFFVGGDLGHVKSLRFLNFRVDFLNHLIIILPVLGHCQKLYFFSALLGKEGKRHFTSDRLARQLLIHPYLTSLLFIQEVGYHKLGVCPALRRGGGGMEPWGWGRFERGIDAISRLRERVPKKFGGENAHVEKFNQRRPSRTQKYMQQRITNGNFKWH